MNSSARLITRTSPPRNLIPRIIFCFLSLFLVPSLLLVQPTLLCDTALGAPSKKTIKKETKFKVTPPERSSFPVDRAEYLLAHKERDDLQKLLAETPVKPADSDVRHVIQAALLALRKDHEKAIAEFEKAKRIMQAGDHALCLVARAYANEQNFDKAIELCGIAIKRSNDDESLTLRADCYVSQKRYQLALLDYAKLARMDPDKCKRYHLKASRVLVICGKHEEALKEADEALKCPGSANDPSAYLTKAQALEKLQRWKEAVDAVTRGYDLAKAKHDHSTEVFCSAALNARARYYDKLGQVSKAAADRRVLEKYSDSIMSELVGDKR